MSEITNIFSGSIILTQAVWVGRGHEQVFEGWEHVSDICLSKRGL